MQIHLHPDSPGPRSPNSALRRLSPSGSRPMAEYGNWQIDQCIGHRKGIASYTAFPLGASQCSEYVLHTPIDPTLESTLALLKREWAISQQIANPHLLPVLDAHLHRSPYFLVTPQLQGHNLREILEQRQKLSIGRTLWILRQASQALEALHAQGWLHPPLDSENILLAPDGHLTLMGVGQASPLTLEEQQMYPQQIHADICRLGGLLLELLGCDQPHEKTTFDWQSIHRLNSLPPAVADLLTYMLSRKSVHHAHSTSRLVRHLVRLEIDFFAKSA